MTSIEGMWVLSISIAVVAGIAIDEAVFYHKRWLAASKRANEHFDRVCELLDQDLERFRKKCEDALVARNRKNDVRLKAIVKVLHNAANGGPITPKQRKLLFDAIALLTSPNKR
jgi:hypothetical protein